MIVPYRDLIHFILKFASEIHFDADIPGGMASERRKGLALPG
jgi:hypothetical protein